VTKGNKTDGKEILTSILEKLSVNIRDFNEVVGKVGNQRLFQTQDYDSLERKIIDIVNDLLNAERLLAQLEAEKTGIPNFLPFVTAFREAAQSYKTVIVGLKSKAQNSGSYGFFCLPAGSKRV